MRPGEIIAFPEPRTGAVLGCARTSVMWSFKDTGSGRQWGDGSSRGRALSRARAAVATEAAVEVDRPALGVDLRLGVGVRRVAVHHAAGTCSLQPAFQAEWLLFEQPVGRGHVPEEAGFVAQHPLGLLVDGRNGVGLVLG